MRTLHKSGTLGFTIVEIMIVVSIIAVLVVLAIPAFNKARQTSLTNKCIENQRMIFEAVHRYEMDNNITFSSIKNNGVIIRDTLVNAGFINVRDAFECPASQTKDWDDVHLLYAGSDFTNTVCTIYAAVHMLR